jgi:ABC-type cobalamin transport system ATPase subunit
MHRRSSSGAVDAWPSPPARTAPKADNGAGKSTLIKAIAGTQPADSGHFRFEGREVSIRKPVDANRLGIETVYQDLALCDDLDTVANLYLGRELGRPAMAPGPVQVLSEPEMEDHAGSRMRELQVTTIDSLRSRVSSLSGGQRQAVAVARATLWERRVRRGRPHRRPVHGPPYRHLQPARNDGARGRLRHRRPGGIAIHVLSWADIGRTICAALRAIAGPTRPLPPVAYAAPARAPSAWLPRSRRSSSR